MFKKARKISGDIGIRARLMSYVVSSKARRLNKYLDNIDIKEELINRSKGLKARRFSCPVLTKRVCRRRESEPILTSLPQKHRSRRTSMFIQNVPSPITREEGGYNDLSLGELRPRSNTGIPSTALKVDYRKLAIRRYSTPVPTVHGIGSCSEMHAMPSTPRFDPVASTSSLQPTLDSHSEEIEDEDKEGKLFISTEYSSDEKRLFVFVTQCGNVKGFESGWKKLIVCFSQILDGKASKKQCMKVERNRTTNDFRNTLTYSLPFGSHIRMVNSWIAVRVKLKVCGILKQNTLKTMEVSLRDVVKDPACRTETLFY